MAELPIVLTIPTDGKTTTRYLINDGFTVITSDLAQSNNLISAN